jgi:hypothetical protein
MAIRHLDLADRSAPRLTVLSGSARATEQRERRHWLTVASLGLVVPFVVAVVSLGMAR